MFSNLACKSSLLSHCVHNQLKPLIRTTSLVPLKSKLLRKSVLINKSEFKIVYDFPYIKYTAALVKSRFSVPLLFAASSCYFYVAQGSLIIALVYLSPGCVHGLMTFGLSFFTKNLVGKVYVNKEGEVKDVLFSSIDRQGNRFDRIHKLEELINCDYPTRISRSFGFIRVSVANSDISYKINVRNCKLIDSAVCDYLFGRVWKINTFEKCSGDIVTDKAMVDEKKMVKEKK